MVPKMLSHPIEPLTFLFFTSVATTLAAGSVSAVSFARNFQSVPVVADRRVDRARRVPRPVRDVGRGRPGGFGREVRRNALTIGVATTAGRDRARGRRAAGDRDPAGRRPVRRGGRRPDGERPGRLRALGPVRGASGTSWRAACTRPTTRCCRCWRRSPGSASRSRRRCSLVGAAGRHRDPARVRGRHGGQGRASRAWPSPGGSGTPRCPSADRRGVTLRLAAAASARRR